MIGNEFVPGPSLVDGPRDERCEMRRKTGEDTNRRADGRGDCGWDQRWEMADVKGWTWGWV